MAKVENPLALELFKAIEKAPQKVVVAEDASVITLALGHVTCKGMSRQSAANQDPDEIPTIKVTEKGLKEHLDCWVHVEQADEDPIEVELNSRVAFYKLAFAEKTPGQFLTELGPGPKTAEIPWMRCLKRKGSGQAVCDVAQPSFE